jgi:hypothetical protein
MSAEWSKGGDSQKSLNYVPKPKWYEQAHRKTKGQSDGFLKRPSYYDFIDGTIFLGPPPSVTGDTIRIVAWLKIADATGAMALTTIPMRFREAILNYATWMVAVSRSHPQAQSCYLQYVMSAQATGAEVAFPK